MSPQFFFHKLTDTTGRISTALLELLSWTFRFKHSVQTSIGIRSLERIHIHLSPLWTKLNLSGGAKFWIINNSRSEAGWENFDSESSFVAPRTQWLSHRLSGGR